MYLLEDLKFNRLYRKQFLLPFIRDDKRHSSAILLLTPNYEVSKSLLSNPFTVDRQKLYTAYYVERDIMYTINQESRMLGIDYPEYDSSGVILESASVFHEDADVCELYADLNDCEINEVFCRLGDKTIFFNEMYEYLEEAGPSYNQKYRNLLYNDRLRNNKSVMPLYDQVKRDFPWITRTFLNYLRYKKFNLFIDLYYYNQAYLKNNSFTLVKSIDMYFEFIRRFINDRRITDAGYTRKTVFVPMYGWETAPGTKVFDFKKNLNPLSVIYKRLRLNPDELKEAFSGITFVFFGANAYFKFDADHIDQQTRMRFMRYSELLSSNLPIPEGEVEDSNEEENSGNAIAAEIIGDIEKGTGAEINDVSGKKANTKEEDDKSKLVEKINQVSKLSKTKDDALDKLETDKDIKRIVASLQDESQDGVKLSAARSSRIISAQDSFLNKQIDGQSIRDMISTANKPKELPESNIPIQTINDEWHHMKATNFEKEYNLDADIMKILNSLSDKDNKAYPISILDVKKVDTSTSEDSVYTYTVNCEGYDGTRFTLHFDIPKFRDNRYMRLRGNEKIFSIEMPLLPISKTSSTRVQIVTFYNKAFVDTYNTSAGRSNPYSDRLIKTINKYTGSDLHFTRGDNSRICEKYDLPIDYIDLASVYNKISFHSNALGQNATIYFNQDEIRKIPGVNPKNGIPVAISANGKCLYFNEKAGVTFSQFLITIFDSKKFKELYEKQTLLKRATYSRVWMLNTYIPAIVVLAHDLGLIKAMDLAGIVYDISESPTIDSDQDSIKLKNGYINYRNTYASMMLMNGLKDCTMEDISIEDLNKKTTWIEQLESFGGRGKSDGLDNFKELMYDPITVDISKDYKLPTTWHEALIYASNILVDNKFTKHTDISTNRYRTNEIVAAQFYRVLTDAYRNYTNLAKRGRKRPMVLKQSSVIDLILQQNNTSDLSVFQPLLELEASRTISTKGVTGLNSERAYTIDKRGYDDSMVNVIAQSTGFASTVGVNRQTTIDPGITAGRGYFKQSTIKDGSVTKSMGMTEALSPFMLTSDDPFRALMGFVQTAKHGTPIEKGLPQLITTGAQEAMPYLSSDMFAFKAKDSGKIKELNDEYMIIEYKNGEKDFVLLSEQTMKNSDGGFYITLQLGTDKKIGDSVKKGEVVAWDKTSYSKSTGLGELSYNTGSIVKVAMMSNEDGYEDSGLCSEWLTDTMASKIVVMKSISLPASTNILSMVSKGQSVKEGEPILIFQNAFDDEDANSLLKNLNIEDGDITTIGRNIVKSKVTGVISDIKLYRTCGLDIMSESMRKIFEGYESKQRALANASKDTNSDFKYSTPKKLPQTGKLKNIENGVLIEIFMQYFDRLSTGDKIVSSIANKNVLYGVYKDSEAPYTDFRPNEQIDVMNSCSAIDGRIITSPFKNGALNKLLIELQRKCCEIYGKPWLNLHEIYDYYYGKKE